MAKKRKSKGFRGGKSRKGRKGLGAGLTSGMARTVTPALVGTGLALGTALGMRAYLRPEPGQTSETIYRNAPLIGIGAGILGAVGLYVIGGGKKPGMELATAAAVAAVVSGGALFGIERLHVSKPGAFAALVPSPSAAPAEGTAGLRAITAEYGMAGGGLNAIVMERLNGNNQQQGAVVNLQGVVDTGAFGSRAYG